MILFGSKGSHLGSYRVEDSTCGYCHQQGTEFITVFGNYAHIFFLPFFPTSKEVISECTHCKRTLFENEFTPQLKATYEQNKHKAQRPFWHWVGIILVVSFILLVFLVGLTT